MKTKLITALRTTANALEQGTFDYEWNNRARCNCGALFCSLTGRSAAELKRDMPDPMYGGTATWKILVGQHCPITGMPSEGLFREIYGHGLTQSDIVHLEFLSDPKVRERMDNKSKLRWFGFKPKTDHQDPAHVAAYMRAWADLLTEQGAMDVVEPNARSADRNSMTTAHARICRELLLTAGTAGLLLPMYIPTNWTGAPPDEPIDPVAWFGAEPEPERREVDEDEAVTEQDL